MRQGISYRMRTVKVFLLLVTALAAFPVTTVMADPDGTPVVVELFTSEACSSCPPADELLTALSQQHRLNGANVLVLGEHVDYFNHLGWTDRFSSRTFTDRQNEYAKRLRLPSPYTPQMVIDGKFECLGSDPELVSRQIAVAAHKRKMAGVDLTWTAPTRLRVHVSGAGGETAAVMLAITEDGLTTSVVHGENRGRVLRHSGIVRELRQLGTTSAGSFLQTASIVPAQGWKVRDLRIIVFVQKRQTGEIEGAASVSFQQAGSVQ